MMDYYKYSVRVQTPSGDQKIISVTHSEGDEEVDDIAHLLCRMRLFQDCKDQNLKMLEEIKFAYIDSNIN
jgi:D-Tyr-tRNAtyr deacylase